MDEIKLNGQKAEEILKIVGIDAGKDGKYSVSGFKIEYEANGILTATVKYFPFLREAKICRMKESING